ncbi:MAG: V-type ATP synthase subunit I [Oscillospiraceae bacterium]|nr:V-type ATP synthase subunit I [Oscillospiraceae bacterium]
MKKITVVGLMSERDALIRRLQLLGCVQVTENPLSADKRLLLTAPTTRAAELALSVSRMKRALELLNKYAPVKTGLLPNLPLISVDDLFSADTAELADNAAAKIFDAESALLAKYAEVGKLENAKSALLPWELLDIPVNVSETKSVGFKFGSIPAQKDLLEFEESLNALERTAVFRAASDNSQNYVLVVYHKSVAEDVSGVLRDYSFNRIYLKDVKGKAADNIRAFDEQAKTVKSELESLLAELKSYGEYRSAIQLRYDRLESELAAETSKGLLLDTDKTFTLTGWVDLPSLPKLEDALVGFTCVYDLADPADGENAPIKFRNNKITEPLNMVTEMYSLPAYTNIDPNPLIAIFFPAFFGMMFADTGYGLLILAVGFIIRRKAPRLRGALGQMSRLSLLCGIWTFLWGAVSGAFFGDLIPTIAKIVSGNSNAAFDLPKLIDPLADPITVMIISLVLGAIHILFGMGVKFYLLCRDGHILDAFLSVGAWWLLFAGIALLALSVTPWAAVAGAVAVAVAPAIQNRSLKKLGAGLASLYDITSYFSDLMSYIRLMALMMAGGVIAMVVNMLGSMPVMGNLLFLPAFIIIFLFGHGFNIGLNIIGTFIHDARLQYLEFYGKFFEEGGKPFKPLSIKTKYVDIQNVQ